MKMKNILFLCCCCCFSNSKPLEGAVLVRRFCRKFSPPGMTYTGSISCAIKCGALAECWEFQILGQTAAAATTSTTAEGSHLCLLSNSTSSDQYQSDQKPIGRYLDCNWEQPKTATTELQQQATTTTKNLSPVPLELFIKTGTVLGASTDAKVNITLFFSISPQLAPISETFPLVNDSYNLFEDGQLDHFQLTTKYLTLGDPCDLVAINLRHDNSGINPPWRPTSVLVRNAITLKEWFIPVKNYVSENVNNCSLTINI